MSQIQHTAAVGAIEFRSVHDGHVLTVHEDGCIQVDDVAIDFAFQETQLLRILMGTPDKLWSKELLMVSLYGTMNVYPSMKILDVYICKMRRKLSKMPGNFQRAIQTIWGRGYLFSERTHNESVLTVSSHPSAYVIGFRGHKVTIRDLPPPNSRWVPSRKAVVVALFKGGVITLSELIQRYPDLTEPELRNWERTIALKGISGLRVTQFDRTHGRIA